MASVERFADRRDAGRRLGRELKSRAPDRPVVLGLPRGGVPVADEIARALDAPLDVLVVRKLGVPWQPEVAMGAVGEQQAVIWNDDVRRTSRIPDHELRALERRERSEVEARVTRFRGGHPPIELTGRTAVVVDDGVATGATARVACTMARQLGADRVVLAIPVAAPDVVADFPEADEVVVLSTPRSFMSVGMHYRDFTQTSDEEVVSILRAGRGDDRH
ncbi:phosphoribosyltransferase [Agromyces aerolatus]|uniref:phosphoribosyltransferase n=1 Tax=Agromyces sp. LY-1074 TaxID=3074080 RepID=UPI00286397FF|nr:MULTISPECIES: phosphoribosyltransferase [unclassified Agromyces]MDR5698885.1 phosphoribosyltransferase [Agromyces sp. LY-1074]MDR5705337.1 phosphoribosyltransferase [Agromyces sp. LY-1358]